LGIKTEKAKNSTYTIKNAIFRLPGWLKWIANVVILLFPGLFSAVMGHIHPLARVVHIGPTFFVGYWIVVALFGFIYFWPSCVSLVRWYESARIFPAIHFDSSSIRIVFAPRQN
jgi:hypothetical protein